MRIVAVLSGLTVMTSAAMSVRAQSPADYEAVRNHIVCYPVGIDMIGRGEMDAGVAAWKQCFSPELQFSLFFGRGDPIAALVPIAQCPPR